MKPVRTLLAIVLAGCLSACQTPPSPSAALHDSPSAPAEISPSGDVTNGANGPIHGGTF